jgi:hypothetical protein
MEKMKSDQLLPQQLMQRERLQPKKLQLMKKLRHHFHSHKRAKYLFQENFQMIERN